jgi:hypothetical protein
VAIERLAAGQAFHKTVQSAFLAGLAGATGRLGLPAVPLRPYLQHDLAAGVSAHDPGQRLTGLSNRSAASTWGRSVPASTRRPSAS